MGKTQHVSNRFAPEKEKVPDGEKRPDLKTKPLEYIARWPGFKNEMYS